MFRSQTARHSLANRERCKQDFRGNRGEETQKASPSPVPPRSVVHRLEALMLVKWTLLDSSLGRFASSNANHVR
jgi:hypothetical protein